MEQPIIYVGGSYSGASTYFIRFVQEFKDELRKEMSKSVVLEWLSDKIADTGEFYVQDLGNISTCNVMIAFVDEPSTGLGFELAEAISRGKRVLCLHRERSIVSRVVLGAAAKGYIAVETFTTFEDAIVKAVTFIRTETLSQ